MTPSPTRHGNNYDLIRLVAALAVVVQHSVTHLDARFLWLEPGDGWWFYDGVPAFFVISGMLVWKSAERSTTPGRGWRSYARNRILRVVPAIWAYLLVTVFTLLLIGVLSPRELVSGGGLAWLGSTALMAPAYSPDFLRDYGVGSVNGSLWTIPVEVSFYFVVPLFVISCTRSGRWRAGLLMTSVALAGLVTGVVLYETALSRYYELTVLPYLFLFLVGVAWAWAARPTPPSWAVACVALLSYIALVWLRGSIEPRWYWVITAGAAIPLSWVIVTLAERLPRSVESWTHRLGDLSFGTYIWHMPIVNLLIWSGATASSRWWTVPVVVALTLLVASASWRLVERPSLDRKRGGWLRPSAAT